MLTVGSALAHTRRLLAAYSNTKRRSNGTVGKGNDNYQWHISMHTGSFRQCIGSL